MNSWPPRPNLASKEKQRAPGGLAAPEARSLGGRTRNETPLQARVCAVAACFYPSPEDLRRLMEALAGQVECLLLVDNGGLNSLGGGHYPDSKVQVLSVGRNLGTAGAYNVGASRALETGHTHILLLDQDSVPGAGMVRELLRLEREQLTLGQRVACVGPLYSDARSGRVFPFVRHDAWRVVREYPNRERTYCLASYVISSGSLIRREAWKAIGPADEGLFLDFTDIEWGLRATAMGFSVLGSFEARMQHALGDNELRLAGLKVALHSPLRHYYAVRNALALCGRTYVDLPIRLTYAVKLIPKFFVYSLFSSAPCEQARFMLRGLIDALIGRMGRHADSRQA